MKELSREECVSINGGSEKSFEMGEEAGRCARKFFDDFGCLLGVILFFK